MEVDQNKLPGVEASNVGVHRREYVGASVLPNGDTTFSGGYSDLVPETSDTVSKAAVERMDMLAGFAERLDKNDLVTLLDETEQYLAAVTQAEHELEDHHPRFSDMIDEWVEKEVEQLGEPADYEAMAGLYGQLYSEMAEEYAEMALDDEFLREQDVSEIDVQAELDVVLSMIDQRIDELLIRDVRQLALERRELALAA